MVGFNRCESPRAPDATEITANVRFPESRRSECTYWDRAECLLMAESRHSEPAGDAQSGQISPQFGPSSRPN